MGSISGAIDSLTRWGATGWAWMPDSPDQVVEVEAVLNDIVICHTLANQKRPDLQAQGKAECGFVLTFNGIVAHGAIPILRTSPKFGAVLLSGEEWSAVTGYVDAVSTWGAVGWAWAPATPDKSVDIEAILDDKIIGRAVADQMRADLATSGRGSGCYGFTLNFHTSISGDKVPEFRVTHQNTKIRLRSVDSINFTIERPTDRESLTAPSRDHAHHSVQPVIHVPEDRFASECSDELSKQIDQILVQYADDKDNSNTKFIVSLTTILKSSPIGSLKIDSIVLKKLLHVGHKSFGCHKAIAQDFYIAAFRHQFFDYSSSLRILEFYVDGRSTTEARDAASFLEGNFKLDAFAHVALSRLNHLEHNRAEAIRHLMIAGQLKPDNAWLRTHVCSRLIEIEEFGLANIEIDRLADDANVATQVGSVRLLELRVKAAVRQMNCSDALTLLQQASPLSLRLSEGVFLQIVNDLARFGRKETEAEARLIQISRDHLLPKIKESEAACLAVIQTCLYRADWENANQYLDGIIGSQIFEARSIICRRFEVACHLGHLSEAHNIYETRWRGRDDLTVTELILSMRYLAEVHAWKEAAGLALHVIVRNMAITDDAYTMLRLVRKSNQHVEFIRTLVDSKRTDTPALHLLQCLVDDCCVQNGRSIYDKVSENLDISQENHVLLPHIVPNEIKRTVGFVCADKNYFFSVFTFFASVAVNCTSSLHWFAFINDDVPKSWSDVLIELSMKLGLSLSIVREFEFLSTGDGGPVTYGLFSGGRALSRSAYFRIYAANWLLQKQQYGRALYVDSDVICEGDLDPLLSADMVGMAVLARPEGASREVEIAAAKCGVGPDKYFNSGVLLFDLGHRDVKTLLEHAIWQAERNPSRLTFHDQCALNIGFAGEAGELPSAFNHFTRPRAGEELTTNSILIHYLERPKPWDTSFQFAHRFYWAKAARIVRAMIPQNIYRELAVAALDLEPCI